MAATDPTADVTARTNTREAWLENAIAQLRPRFVEIGMPLPERIHVSVGFGYGAKAESKIIAGQAWATFMSADGVNHVFISPALDDTARVLDVLVHELIHVADDLAHGHGKEFAEAATRLGLVGKMTATTASPELADELFLLATELGHYPHGKLDPTSVRVAVPAGPGGIPGRGRTGPATQRNRHHLCRCPIDGYQVRITSKWLAVGLPSCPAGHQMPEV